MCIFVSCAVGGGFCHLPCLFTCLALCYFAFSTVGVVKFNVTHEIEAHSHSHASISSIQKTTTQASPTGQKIFDKLLKACNEVVWKGESIVVLKEIRVDPPYTAENCVLIRGGGGGGGGSGGGNGGSGSAAGAGGGSGGLDEHSLERVKKIVLAASSTAM